MAAIIQREIDLRLTRHKEQNNQLGISLDALADLAESLEGIDDAEKVAEVEAMFRELIELENDVTHHITALGETKRKIAGGALNYRVDENGQTQANDKAEDLADAFKETVAKLESQTKADQNKYKKHAKYAEFSRKVWEVKHPGEPMPDEQDAELFVMNKNKNVDLHCPITRMLLEDPVKNKNCGHHYSREAILHHIKKAQTQKHGNPTAACPVAGCSSRVTSNSLEPAPDMKRKVEQFRAEEAKRGKKATQNPDEEVLQL